VRKNGVAHVPQRPCRPFANRFGEKLTFLAFLTFFANNFGVAPKSLALHLTFYKQDKHLAINLKIACTFFLQDIG
jgi:hypothetical protein